MQAHARTDLVESLRDTVDAAMAGGGRIVLLQYDGEYSSALLDGFLAERHARGTRVLRTRCDTNDASLAPWLDLLPGLARESAQRPLASRFRRFATAATELRQMAGQGPVLAVLDSLERADRTSLLLLEALAAEIGQWPLAIVATYRSHAGTFAFEDMLTELARDPACRHLGVGGEGRERTPERALFRPDGEYWTIAFEGRVVRLRDSRGLRCLSMLLARPGERVHVSDLQAYAAGRDPMPDERARTSRADVTRARLAVTKSIKAALDRVTAAHAPLGRYLRSTVRRGYSCVYVPDVRRPIAWRR